MLPQVNASIVIYHNKKEQLIKAINSFLSTDLNVKLYLVDNSTNDSLKDLSKLDSRIEYIFNNSNIGYGAAHNIALKKSIENDVSFHLIINPDVYFAEGILKELYNFCISHSDVGQVMPKVLNPDGSTQYLCKLLPTPFDLLGRRFLPGNLISKRNELYELRFTGYNLLMEVPCLSGCFMFLRVDTIKEAGFFDERFFMYLEDFDLTRRINNVSRTVFYPHVSVIHSHCKQSYKSFKMLYIHIKSAALYFNKWGWFFDKERKEVNEETLKRLRC